MSLFGWLAVLSFVAELVFAAFAFVFVRRLLKRAPTAVSERIGSVHTVLHKSRKGEPMSQDELDFAIQTIADRRSPMAYSIPAALFAIGCLYVFGKLDQLHGAAPSWATFIGVLPMLAAINLAAQLHKISHLKGRVEQIEPTLPENSRSGVIADQRVDGGDGRPSEPHRSGHR